MKLAIIGASRGQLDLCRKAREKGVYTICFAWEKGAICKDYVDEFYPISIFEKEKILEICREQKIDGVLSNGSDQLVDITSYIAEKLNLIGSPVETIRSIKDKYKTRELSNEVSGLKSIRYYRYNGEDYKIYPCVVKPIVGSGKKGVYFVDNPDHFEKAIDYAKEISDEILIEEYIEGVEVSVETISYKGSHYVIQITDKVNDGYPHFAELAHHQPSLLECEIKDKIKKVIPKILDKVGFLNGASCIELKVDSQNNIYLIEVNARSGGDEVASKLVYLSTGYDYLWCMISVALGIFEEPIIEDLAYSGICYLCKQTENYLPFFKSLNKVTYPWVMEYDIVNFNLIESKGNDTRNGYFIYKANHKIDCNNIAKLEIE